MSPLNFRNAAVSNYESCSSGTGTLGSLRSQHLQHLETKRKRRHSTWHRILVDLILKFWLRQILEVGSFDQAEPWSGRVQLNGRVLDGLPTEQRRVGILFQDDLLFLHMTVRENLLFALPAGPRAQREAAVVQALDELVVVQRGDDRDADRLLGRTWAAGSVVGHEFRACGPFSFSWFRDSGRSRAWAAI